jgi:uncharacterized protein (TIRG00374 family)
MTRPAGAGHTGRVLRPDAATGVASISDQLSEPALDQPVSPRRLRRVLRALQYVMLLVVPLLIYWWLFRKIGLGRTFEDIRRASRWSLAAACCSSLIASVLMNSLVWQRILSAMGFRLSFLRAIYAENASLPLRMLLPAKAGEVFKGMYLKSIGLTGLGLGLGSVVFHKAVNIIALMMLSVPAVLTAEGSTARKLFIFLAASLWFYFWPRRFHSLIHRVSRPLPQRLRDAVSNMIRAFSGTPPGSKAQLLILAVVFQAAHLVSASLIFGSLGVAVPIGALCAYLPVAVLVGVVPIALYGLGTREAAFFYFFSPYVGPQAAMAAAVLFTAIQFLLPVVVGSLMTWPFVTTVLSTAPRKFGTEFVASEPSRPRPGQQQNGHGGTAS